MILLAIDPGDRWTGIASIEVRGSRSIWRTGVLDSEDDYLRPVSWIVDIIEGFDANDMLLTIEDFRVRSVGHQSFNAMMTPRLIGAIDYATRGILKRPMKYISPGDIEGDIEKLGLTTILSEWAKHWPPSGRSDWEHARSAWRLLGLTILEHSDLHYLITEPHLRYRPRRSRGETLWTRQLDTKKDLWAPPLRLRKAT